MNCQAEGGKGPCTFVAVRMVQGSVPTTGFPPRHPFSSFEPGEPVATYSCALHVRGVVESLQDLGLIDVFTAPPPGPGWHADGHT
jgi:hypothetical protein